MSEQINYVPILKERKPPEGLLGWIAKQGGLSREYLVYGSGWFLPDPLTDIRGRCADVVCTACGGSFKVMRSASEGGGCSRGGYARFGFFHPETNELVHSGDDTVCPFCGAKAKAKHVSDFGGYMRQRAWTTEIAVIEAGEAGPRLAVLEWMTERGTDREGVSRYHTALWEAYIVEERKIVSVRGYDNFMGNCVETSQLRQHKSFRNNFGEYELLWPWDPAILEGTTAENSKLDLYIKAGGTRLVDWLALWRKRPQAENLLVQGCGKLVAGLIDAEAHTYDRGNIPQLHEIDWKEKRPHAMLRMTKEDFRTFGRRLTIGGFKVFCWARENGVELRRGYEDVKELENNSARDTLLETVGARDFWRWAGYLKKQRRDAIMLRDYLNMAKKLKMDIQDPQVLWPRDLKAAHDRVTALYNARKDALNNEKWAARAAQLQKFAWERDGILIRPCATQGELRAEGSTLHHCVFSYADQVIKGQTAIFFIRRVDKPDEPWYTLELDEKTFTVRQDRGLRNCGRTPEVEEFEKAWVNWLKETFEKQTKKKPAGKTAAA